jgi:hypothetical protein
MTSSSIKITCECGAVVNKSGLLPHKKTTKHNLLMEKAAWKQTAAKDAKQAKQVKATAKKEEQTYQVQYDVLGKVLKRIFGGEMTYNALMMYDDEDEYKLVVETTDYDDEHIQHFRVFIDYKEVLDVSYGNNFQLDMRHHLEAMREDDDDEDGEDDEDEDEDE